MKAHLVALVFMLAITSLPGCEVSVFGGEPIVIGGSDVGTGGNAVACGEPDDARRARAERDGDGCAERCRIENGAIVGECEAIVVDAERPGVASIDLSQADGLVIELEVCDPRGTVLEIADASSLAASSHDARLTLEGTTMTVRASEGSSVAASELRDWIAAAGCTTRTISLTDQIVYFADADAGLCGIALLRISPPTDAQGTPDARWYVGLGTSVEGATATPSPTGSGPRSLDFCFW